MRAAWQTDAHNLMEEELRLVPFFYEGSVKDVPASTAAGRDIFKSVPFVRISVPGDRTIQFDQPALIDEDSINPNPKAHNIRFPRHWDAFKRNMSQEGTIGTPLRETAFARSVVDSLASYSIHTLEQLAEISDAGCEKIMNGHMWRQKARDMIASASGSAAVLRIRAELDAREDENAELRKLIAEQQERLGRLEAKQNKKAKEAPALLTTP